MGSSLYGKIIAYVARFNMAIECGSIPHLPAKISKMKRNVGGQPKQDKRIGATVTIRQSVIDKIGISAFRKEIHAHFENETTLKKLINQK